MSFSIAPTRFLFCLIALLQFDAASAAEKQARLTIDIRVKGSESAQADSDWGKSTISQQYHLVTTVKTDGVLSSINNKDPDYNTKAMAKVAHDQARIRAVQERNAAAGVGPKPVSAAAASALVQEMQAAVKQCGNNQQCQQSVAMKYSSRPDFAAAMAALATPEYACKQRSGGDAARERECLQASGVGAANTEQVDPDEEEAEPDERYLTYIGWIGCPTQISMQIDDRLEGAYADVGGMVPYVQTKKAAWNGRDADRTGLCVHYTMVLDTKDRKLYTDGLYMPEVHGTSLYSEPGKGRADQRFEGPVSGLPPAAANFVWQTLRVATTSGTKHATVKLDQPYLPRPPIKKYNGSVDVDVSWKFEPL